MTKPSSEKGGFLIFLACTDLTQKEFTSGWECPQGGILFMTSDMVNDDDD
jgi:hypothetical protein